MRPEAGTPRRLRGLYAITPEDSDTARLAGRVAACLQGGPAVLQYRAKSAGPALRLAQALRLRELCRGTGTLFVVNDDLELALAVDADGLHIGRDDGDIERTRERLGGRLLGVSCYDDALRAQVAAASGADYVAIGSVFASATKPGAVRAPLERIAEARRSSGRPVVAIGGLTAANAPAAIAAGADMVAVVTAIFEAADPAAAARAIARLFELPALESDDVRTQPAAL